MAVETVAMYRLICDFPGCYVASTDGTDWTAMASKECVYELATDAEWFEGVDDKRYCRKHPFAWATELEEELAEEPEKPYLLLVDDVDAGRDGPTILILAPPTTIDEAIALMEAS